MCRSRIEGEERKLRFEEVETAQRETSDDQTGDEACGLYFPYSGEHGAGVWTFGPILRALPSSFLRKEPTLRSILWSRWKGAAWW